MLFMVYSNMSKVTKKYWFIHRKEVETYFSKNIYVRFYGTI